MSSNPTSSTNPGQQVEIADEGSLHEYATLLPNTVVRGLKSRNLSVYTKWLYVYIKSRAGEKGTCYTSTTTIAEEAGMSRGQVSAAKKELIAQGLITVKPGKNPRRNADNMRIKDIWLANMQEFSVHNTNTEDEEQMKTPQDSEPPSVHHTNTEPVSVHSMNSVFTIRTGCSQYEQLRSFPEEDPLKKEETNSLTTFESLGESEIFGSSQPTRTDRGATPSQPKKFRKKTPLASDDWLALWMQQQTLLDIPYAFLDDEKWWAAASILVTDGFNEAWLNREFAKMVLHFQIPGESPPRTEAGWKRFLTYWFKLADKIEQREKRQEKRYGATAQARR